ncbi:hypothetical protein IKL64_00795 [bacterium]|nr:hypothetical protein [bacterium]
MAGISAIFSGLKRVAKVLPDLVLGNGAETAGQAIRATIKNKGSIFQAAKEGVKATEKLSVAANGAKIGFFTRITSNIGRISSLTKAGIRAGGAKAGFFGKILGGTKGFFKGLGKNMPLIGALMMIAFEIPNVVKASKEQGIGQGVKEIAKAGARLCGGGVGAAIGSAICPGIGTMIGWIAGEWLTSKVVGKSYSEKVAEAEYEAQLAAEQAQQQGYVPQEQVVYPQETVAYQPAQQPTFQGNPYQQQTPYPQGAVTNPFEEILNNNATSNPYGGNTFGYSGDLFAQNINFAQLASNMTSGQLQMQQPLQAQPQVSIINP